MILRHCVTWFNYSDSRQRTEDPNCWSFRAIARYHFHLRCKVGNVICFCCFCLFVVVVCLFFVFFLFLFTLFLFRPFGFKFPSSRIQKLSLCFNKFFLVSLLKVLLRICSIIIKLASLLKVWFFIAKWRAAGLASDLYISLRWLFSLKLKSVPPLPAYCMWHFLHSLR